MIYITILCGCWLLYGSGLWARFMNKFKLEPTPAPPPQPTRATPPPHQEPPAPAKQVKTIDLERMQLEKIAGNIILYQGYKKDAFKLVKGLDNETLTEIITTFKNELDL